MTTLDASQLPFLLRLLDDDSPQVRDKVAKALRRLGPGVRSEIRELGVPLTDEQMALLEAILPSEAPEAVAAKGNPWLYWMRLGDEYEKLEAAFSLLAEWHLGHDYPAQLADLLDELAQEFWESGHLPDSEALSVFLFHQKGFRGVEPNHYYEPGNSNLVSVIESRHGLPISLASVFMLVGKRLGLEIYGCNFPGHFLARARQGAEDIIFDCFNAGRMLSKSEVEALYKAIPAEMASPTPAVTMIARVLSNMAVAFDHEGEKVKMQFILTLLSELHDAMK
ncbi:MAG: hypothetical protein JO316_22540 [Abitibacteriaceae bacterium]|nr:hypothetical protein [Abditibacteriaceae bacterium]MBV9868143.1 hypothetical protein [Abditibacteriaceae bacterium]